MNTGGSRSGPLWRTPVSRRAALRGGAIGGAGLAAAALIGCGNGDDDAPAAPPAPARQAAPAASPVTATATDAGSATPTATPAAPATPTPSPAVAPEGPRRGGIFRIHQWFTPPSLDPHRTLDFSTKGAASYIYSKLFTQIPVVFDEVPNPEMAGDLVESWEFTPDRDRLTLTLVPNATFTDPINRTVDSEDVRFSVERFRGLNGHDPAPNASQLDFIQGMETPDARTMTFNMAPLARVLWRLADMFNMHIMPRETGSAFDPTQTMIGSGPFIWDELVQDVSFKVVRNPGWFSGPDVPYLDAVHELIVQPLTALTQFQAGSIDLLITPTPDFVPALIRNYPEGRIVPRKALGFVYLAFGEPRDGSAPWADARVRRAISLSLNRADMITALYNVDGLEEVGLEVASRVAWHNILPAGFKGQSVDPQTDAATGRWIRYDVAEARKLLEAAGYGDGFELPYHYTAAFGPAWIQETEIIPQLVSEIGITFKTNVVDYASEYVPKTIRGEFDGIALQLQVFPGLEDFLTDLYASPGASGGNLNKVEDAAIGAAVDDINTTFDIDERNEKVRNIQRDLLVDAMWFVPSVGFQLDWVGLGPRAGIPDAWHGNGRGDYQSYGFPWWWVNEE